MSEQRRNWGKVGNYKPEANRNARAENYSNYNFKKKRAPEWLKSDFSRQKKNQLKRTFEIIESEAKGKGMKLNKA